MATMVWLMAFVVPFLVLTYSFLRFKNQITKFEYVSSAAIGYFLTVALLFMVEGTYTYGAGSDTEIWNGYVSDKYSNHVSCEHKYPCGRICSGSGKRRSCHIKYCHEHSYDVDWVVKTTVGNVEIDRVDRRGLETPPRFAQVKVGEPASSENYYQNSLLLDEDSLFYNSDKIVGTYSVPQYPVVRDYYRITRVFNDTALDLSNWNRILNERLAVDGAALQLNMVVFVTNSPSAYADAVFAAWKGGKKNDVIIVLGNQSGKVQWIRSTSFAKGMGNELLHAKLLSTAIGETIDDKLVMDLYNTTAKTYKRYTMEQFEKMVHTNPKYPIGVYIIVLIFSTGLMFGIVRLAIAVDYMSVLREIFKSKNVKQGKRHG